MTNQINHGQDAEQQIPGMVNGLWDDLFLPGTLEDLSKHPLLVACREGQADLHLLRTFLIQHHHYSTYFTRYLCAMMGNLAQSSDVKSLAQNLREEMGEGIDDHVTHAELFLRSMKAIDAVPLSAPALPATRELIATMFKYCRNSDAIDGLAALCLGAEAIVPVIYQPIVDAMRTLGVSDEGRYFFELHVIADEDHALAMRAIMLRMFDERPYTRAKAIAIGEEMVRSRMKFFDDVWTAIKSPLRHAA